MLPACKGSVIMEKPTILFLTQLPPPVHGASAVNLSIKNSNIINQNLNAHYFNISPAKNLSDIGKLSALKILSFFHIFFKSITLYLTIKPQLVYITLSPHGLAFYKDGLIALALKIMGGKLVFHMHGKGIKSKVTHSRINLFIYKLVFKKVDIIHLSELLFSDIEDVRDKKTKLLSLSNGIEYSNTKSLKPEKFTFIYLSNFVPAKGTDIFIQAVSIANKKKPNSFEAKLVGGTRDPLYAKLLSNLITPELEKIITMHGPLYGDKKNNSLLSSNVFVLPTKNDCFPLSILEAMASGLAVISTKEGAIPSMVDHGITGDLIDSATPEILASAMLKHIEDQHYSNSCSIAGKKKFNEMYSISHFENGLLQTLRNIL